MKIGMIMMVASGGLLTAGALLFLQDAIQTMVPWLIAIGTVVITDLIAGCRKSVKLGVHLSLSSAIRETMGKTVVYLSFVMASCMVDAAIHHSFEFAMWSCLVIVIVEFSSIISNILKPHGIDISVSGILRWYAVKKLGVSSDEAKEIVRRDNRVSIRRVEQEKWNRPKYRWRRNENKD